MSILVDTSVWSLLLLRKKTSPHPAALFLKRQIEEKTGLRLTGIIYQEVLQGIRSDTLFQSIKSYLREIPCLEMPPVLHEEAARLFNRCRQKGIQAGTVDCLIATASIHFDSPLLTTDPDFRHIAQYSDLRLVNYHSVIDKSPTNNS